jgi:arsenite-transporting ATPase
MARRPPAAISYPPSRRGRADAMRVVRDASLLFFGGKGGVGKTTVSAAAAIQLAREDSERRVLLLSTDPAHSLADVLRSPIGDSPRTIPAAPRNLHVCELDAARAFAARRVQIEAGFGEIASTFGATDDDGRRGLAVQSPSAAAAELIDLAPPGVDELFAVLSVIEARAAFDFIIVDTAPTGHALRLLEMPEVARDWTQVLLRMLLKYKSMVRPGRLAEELLAIAKSIRDLQTLIRDGAQTRFVVVTRAAEVPRRETVRLVDRLRHLRLAIPAVVVNAMTLAPGRCRRCRVVAATEARQLAALRRAGSRPCAIIQTPLTAPPPRGTRALASWATTWAAAAGR